MNPRIKVPPHQARPLPQMPTKLDQQEIKQMLRNDAEIAVISLNESKGSAHKRLSSIRHDLERIRLGVVNLQEIDRAIGQEMFPERANGPGRSGTKKHLELASEYKKGFAALEPLFSSVNKRLRNYAFRPCVSHALFSNEWRFGVVPDTRTGAFQIMIGTFLITEADAVLAMVRLEATGELNKVRLCETCKKRWRVSHREMDRFCSEECRQAFHMSSPGAKERNAAKQRRYRERLKRNIANGANLK
jgi:hypothetical protein